MACDVSVNSDSSSYYFYFIFIYIFCYPHQCRLRVDHKSRYPCFSSGSFSKLGHFYTCRINPSLPIILNHSNSCLTSENQGSKMLTLRREVPTLPNVERGKFALAALENKT